MEKAFQQCVAEVADRGAAVLLSSHILAEVEKLCDNVTIIRAGRAVRSGTLDRVAAPDAHHRHGAHPRRRASRCSARRTCTISAIDDGQTPFSVDRDDLDRAMAQLTDLGIVELIGGAGVAGGHVPARVPGGEPMSTTAVATARRAA